MPTRPDGRLVIVFRDTALASSTKFNFVAWVGTYDDLVNGREGEYRVLLLRHQGNFPPEEYGDCGYAGLEVLPDGTFVATTYLIHKPGEETLRRQCALQSGGVGTIIRI